MLRSHLEPLSFQERFHIHTKGTAALAPNESLAEQQEEPLVSRPIPSAAGLPPALSGAVGCEEPAVSAVPSQEVTVPLEKALMDTEEPLTYTEEMPSDPFDTACVKNDRDLPKADNSHVLPESCGIVYEVAEELYRREKTASEIEALCQPPFKKVFDREQLEQLDRQAREDTFRLLSAEGMGNPASDDTKTFSMGTAFWLQAVLFVPVLNLVTALLFSFRRAANPKTSGIQVYCRAFLAWMAVLMTAALIFFAVSYFSDPAHTGFYQKLTLLFGT